MRDISQIVAHVQTNPLGVRESVTYEWQGKSPYVYVSWNLIQDIYTPGDTISPMQFGPYKLLRVEEDPSRGAILYVRADKFGALRVFLYRASRWLDLAYRRMIITLAVWGLAEYQQWRMPTWRDIKIFKR